MFKINFNHIIFLLLVCFFSTQFAQSTRGLINDGVDSYEENKFAESEVNFKKAIEADIESFESKFNHGDAIYKQGRFEEAIEEFKNSFPLAETDELKGKIFHNIGNSLLKAQKLKESIGAYREALKLNPNDMETKYNLSYAIKQMQNQQNQDNQDQDQDQNKDQNKEDENKEQQKDQQKEDQKDQSKEQQNEQQQPEPKDEISKDEAQRILDALKNNEAELQKKMREQKTKKSNVEKDW